MDAIEEPASGQLVVFRDRTNDYVAADLYMRPGGFVPMHVHGRQIERFEAVSGALRFRLGRHCRTVGPGEEVTVPAGTPHGFRNVGSEVAHFLIELTPPLRGEEGLRTLFGLQRDGRLRVPRLGVPRPLLQVAVLFDQYLDEIHLPVAPVAAQRVVFGALARLGRWRGYGSTFPEYLRDGGAATQRLATRPITTFAFHGRAAELELDQRGGDGPDVEAGCSGELVRTRRSAA
jgi:mannose-6-phosphate isomerase-like protein (cupin superfamily)